MWSPFWFLVSAAWPTLSLGAVFGIYLWLLSRPATLGLSPVQMREKNLTMVFTYLVPFWFAQTLILMILAIIQDGFLHAVPGLSILLLITGMIAVSLGKEDWQRIANNNPLVGPMDGPFLGSPQFLILGFIFTFCLWLALRYDLI